MNPEINPEEIDVNDSKASLGFSNMLREQLFKEENPPIEEEMDMTDEMPMEGEPMQEPEEEPKEEPEEPEEDDSEELKSLEKRMKKMIKDEIGGIKEMIKEVLNEDDGQEK